MIKSSVLRKWIFGVIFAILYSTTVLANEPKSVEIPVARVLIPSTGFDDNDNVQFVVTGELPDPCYVLGKTVTQWLSSSQISVQQFAWRRMDGACESGQPTGDGAYFMTDVSLGRMKEGDYTFHYRSDLKSSRVFVRGFSVAKSGTISPDRLNYAPISNAVAEDVIWEGDLVSLRISGVLPNNCSEIEEPVEVIKLDDVAVVLPVMKKSGVTCYPGLFPYKMDINLGKLPAGVNLIHVRSRGGTSVNRIIRVVPKH